MCVNCVFNMEANETWNQTEMAWNPYPNMFGATFIPVTSLTIFLYKNRGATLHIGKITCE